MHSNDKSRRKQQRKEKKRKEMTAMKVLYDTPTVTSKRHQTRIEIYYYCRKNDKIIDSIVTQNVSLTNTHTHTFFQD